MRLFTCIDIPAYIKVALTDSLGKMRMGNCNVSSAENMHITLNFMDDVEDKLLDRIKEGIDGVSFGGFDVEIKGLGIFEDKLHGILFANVHDENSACSRLQKNLREMLTNIGIETSSRSYTPHVTLARCTKIGDKLRDIVKNSNEGFGKFSVGSFALKKSVLASDGAVHSVLYEKRATSPAPR